MNTSQYPIIPDLKFQPGTTMLHCLHPISKVILLSAFNIAVFTAESWQTGCVLLICMLLGYHFAGLGLAFFFRKLRFILFFCSLIIVVQVLFTKQGHIIVQIPLGIFTVEIWSHSLQKGIELALRFLNVIGSSFLFVFITQPKQLAYALMQMGIPYRFGFMLVIALRFIPAFQQEFQAIRNAQMAKGINFTKKSIGTFRQMIQYVFVPLIVSSISKVNVLALSMEGRAFGKYKTRTFIDKQNLNMEDKMVIFICIIFIVIVLIG